MATLITLKNETTLRQLADRIYGTLEDKDRTRAENALLKANPHLGKREAFKPGAVVNLPSVRGLKPKAAATRNDPVSDVRDAVGAAVEEYQGRLAASIDAGMSDLAAQEELLKDKEVTAALKKAGATELAKQLTESLRTRAKTLAEDRKRQETLFARIGADLKAIDLG
jgi:hypothetical protein